MKGITFFGGKCIETITDFVYAHYTFRKKLMLSQLSLQFRYLKRFLSVFYVDNCSQLYFLTLVILLPKVIFLETTLFPWGGTLAFVNILLDSNVPNMIRYASIFVAGCPFADRKWTFQTNQNRPFLVRFRILSLEYAMRKQPNLISE